MIETGTVVDVQYVDQTFRGTPSSSVKARKCVITNQGSSNPNCLNFLKNAYKVYQGVPPTYCHRTVNAKGRVYIDKAVWKTCEKYRWQEARKRAEKGSVGEEREGKVRKNDEKAGEKGKQSVPHKRSTAMTADVKISKFVRNLLAETFWSVLQVEIISLRSTHLALVMRACKCYVTAPQPA